MTYDTVQVDHRDGVSVCTLDRPPVNAVSPALMRDVLAGARRPAFLGVVPSWGMSLTRLTHDIGRDRALGMAAFT